MHIKWPKSRESEMVSLDSTLFWDDVIKDRFFSYIPNTNRYTHYNTFSVAFHLYYNSWCTNSYILNTLKIFTLLRETLLSSHHYDRVMGGKPHLLS